MATTEPPAALPTGQPREIRVLALMEARTVTGPAKNLLAFADQARNHAPGDLPQLHLSVATFDRPGISCEAFHAALRERGIPYRPIAEKRAGDLGVLSRLRALIAEVRPGIVQTHNSKSHLLLRLLGRRGMPPWIAFHHGFTAVDWKDRAYSRIAVWALKGAPQVVAVCRAFSQDLVRQGVREDRIAIRHNSVTPLAAPSGEELAALKARLGIPAGARVLLTVGRMSSEKGHRDLLEAVARLQAANAAPDLRLVVVGDGPEMPALREAAAALGIAGSVLFPGHQSQVRPFYGIASLFVLPSHSEGSPNVLLEAMSAGLPIVATAVGGSVELVVDGETALLVKARDPQALSGAIRRLLDGADLAARLARNAQVESARYTPEAYTRAMLGLYVRVLAARRD